MDLALRRLDLRVRRGWTGQPHVLAEVERDLAAAAAQGTGADPDDLAPGAELVEPGRAVGAEAPREHVTLPDLRRERDSLERDESLTQPVGSRPGRPEGVDVLPVGQEPRKLSGLDRL